MDSLVIVALALVTTSNKAFHIPTHTRPSEVAGKAVEGPEVSRMACRQGRVKLMKDFGPPVSALWNKDAVLI